ncbi:unnamed protein product [Sphagnum jensenii]|uniref:Uncharacterized protein n=1 Tax=Sphagnum jensenii TaxID=128206 RepID=A0ABP0V8W9_9BRYO
MPLSALSAQEEQRLLDDILGDILDAEADPMEDSRAGAAVGSSNGDSDEAEYEALRKSSIKPCALARVSAGPACKWAEDVEAPLLIPIESPRLNIQTIKPIQAAMPSMVS